MDNITITSEDFRELFSFPYNDFSDPIPWSDAVGMSRVKKYPNGFASLYKIGVVDREFRKETKRKQLWVTASYGKDTPNGITLGSAEKISDPVDIEFKDEFSVDLETKTFYFKGKEISPLGILTLVEKNHTKPTKFVRGFILRVRLRFWRKLLPFLIKIFDVFIQCVLWIISGERTKEDVWGRMIADIHTRYEDPIRTNRPTPLEHREFKEGDTIDFFGYKAKRWSVVFYSSVHLFIFIVAYIMDKQSPILTKLFSNSFLTLCYIVVSFAGSEYLLPEILKKILNNFIPKIFNKVTFKRIKI